MVTRSVFGNPIETDAVLIKPSAVVFQNGEMEKKEDGFYYWKEPLQPGEATETLFDTVTIRADVAKEELETFDIQVYAEAVQSQGKSEENAWLTMK